jgi:hypothetical protein
MNILIIKLINPFITKYREKSIEKILDKSLKIIDKQTIDEIKYRTSNFITDEGAFCDRSGKSDIYYSLFGMFVWEALNPNVINENLKNYIHQFELSVNNEGVYLYCLSIMNSRLGLKNKQLINIDKQLKNSLKKNILNPDYHLFMGILALHYSQDYLGIFQIVRKIDTNEDEKEIPCPVLAAKLVISKFKRQNTEILKQKLMTYYRGDGSFSALKKSPVSDLLSTAVALFALNFINADLRLIKPACLEYIDSLYHNGSFRATSLDFDTDIEYTFYGMLALGSM